ncbi:alpha/beta hydrolase family protein [Coralloluteibacterium thermophilus]|uniref:Alpha/beta hydrolase family protein n=1 Tax=Coralloluteibacterium thermophilum TaxID=2707049 RepID=A0ABV9NIV6_9GAMM
MKYLRILVAALAALASPLFAQSVEMPSEPAVGAFAAFPALSSLSVSPAGTHIAGLRAIGEERQIVVWRTDALHEAPIVIGSDRMKFESVAFIKEGLLAVSLWQPYDLRADRVTKTFISKFFITDIEGRQWKEPLIQQRAMSRSQELEQALSNASVLDVLPNDPDHVLVVSGSGSNSGDVYRVNIRNYTARRIQRTDQRVAGYITDLEGELRARLRTDLDGTGAFVATEFRNVATDRWEEHFRSYVKDRDINEVLGFSADPNIAFVRSNVGRDKSAIYEYDVAARRRGELLFESSAFDAGNVLVNRIRDRRQIAFGEVMGLSYAGPRGEDVVWTAPFMRALDAGVRDALGIQQDPVRIVDPSTGQETEVPYDTAVSYRITGASNDMRVVLLSVSGPSQPPRHYMLRDGQLSLLADTFPQLDPAVLGHTRLVYYKARDGLDIPAFLTTPSREDCGAGPWPGVVHPHGGPWSRDNMDFDGSMWVPLMVSRCIAVLRPQFRGSAGWGRALWLAGDAEWGKKMQDDKDDGAQWMIDQGIATPGRIAMFGYSYGGYASFVASIRPAGIYKCAIAGAGVSDIRRIWARFYTNPFFRQAQAHTVDGLNPVDHAAEIRIPLMVYHGDRDVVVPPEQSDWFVSRARNAEHAVDHHLIADYAHGPAWTRATMAEQLGLIDTYLRNGCGGSGL